MQPAIIGSIFFGVHWLPFVIAGGLKVLYDLALLHAFRKADRAE